MTDNNPAAQADDSHDGAGQVGPRDLREWIERIEAVGQLKHITQEIDPDEEMSALTYMAHQTTGAPALIFDRVKGCPPGFRALWNPLGSNPARFALGIGESAGMSALDLIQCCRTKFNRRRKPVTVSGKDAPVNTHSQIGADVDISIFASARHWPRDGGRYIGTCDATLTRDPDGGWLNVGCYRHMVHDKNHVGLFLSPGKDARLHIESYWARNEPCEVTMAWGIWPAMFIGAALGFSKNESELDFIGGITGAPVELVDGVTGSVPYPARAEVVAEGVIYPNAMKMEGPFGEFTGYYGRPEGPAHLVEIKAVHYRDAPIITHALMAEYPACETGQLLCIARSAKIWNDLEKIGIPGIRGVYCHPAAAAGFGATVVSLEQLYPGHAAQVLGVAAQCPSGAFYTKWIIAVDHDVDPSNLNHVLWAMGTRCSPVKDIDILRNTWSTSLDPTLNPVEERPYSSKALINACMEHRYISSFAKRTKLSRGVYESLVERWRSFGFEADAPRVLAFEDKPTLG